MTSYGKRKIWAESKKQRKKKKKAATETERMELDRLSDLPEELKLSIISCLDDTKQVVQTSILSRSWVSLWTRIPVLQFNFYKSFPNNPQSFRKFVRKVLSRRDPLAKLDSLKFQYHNYRYRMQCSAKFLKRVFDYAFSHGVKHLEAVIHGLSGNHSCWPVSLCDSLTTLKLEASQTWCNKIMIRSTFLGPRSVLFKNLTVLSLIGAEITHVDEPFSGFPLLERLKLFDCNCWRKGTTDINLKVHAFRLTHLNLRGCTMGPCLELRTPRLRSLKYRYNYTRHNKDKDNDDEDDEDSDDDDDYSVPVIKHEGLPVLETLEIDFPNVNTSIYPQYPPFTKKRKFDDLMSFLSTLHNVKSLTLHLDTVFYLLLFSDELVSSPFRDLKELKLGFHHIDCPDLVWWISQNPNVSRESFECVKAYLLQNSPRAKLTIIELWPQPEDDKLCTCFRFLNL